MQVTVNQQGTNVIVQAPAQGPPGPPGPSLTNTLVAAFKAVLLGNATTLYEELTIANGQVVAVSTWTDSSKAVLLCTETRTYTNGLMTQAVFDGGIHGVLTQAFAYDGLRLRSVSSAIAGPATNALIGTIAQPQALTGVLSSASGLSGTISQPQTLTGVLTSSPALVGTINQPQIFSGLLSASPALVGAINQPQTLTGVLTSNNALTGTISQPQTLTGSLTDSVSVLPTIALLTLF